MADRGDVSKRTGCPSWADLLVGDRTMTVRWWSCRQSFITTIIPPRCFFLFPRNSRWHSLRERATPSKCLSLGRFHESNNSNALAKRDATGAKRPQAGEHRRELEDFFHR